VWSKTPTGDAIEDGIDIALLGREPAQRRRELSSSSGGRNSDLLATLGNSVVHWLPPKLGRR
jgi:hypothetical protein